MTRYEALKAAERCFKAVEALQLTASTPEGNKSYAMRAQALAEAGKGYVALAKELREGP